ncbi:NADPH-adrenodoxin reductase [Tilletia horrida]|nr:NADPH-adrenodoxin reductase [Tilletia horrida]
MAAAAAQPIKLAIIGSGPSAFYAATRALTAVTTTASMPPVSAVHIYESLPTPFGLVRAGVAPDHPDVKNVVHRFSEVVRAARPGCSTSGSGSGQFRFFGNVKVVAGAVSSGGSTLRSGNGTAVELPLEEILRNYTHVVLAYGSAQARTLGSRVAGQDLRGVCSALDFVNWYNGHPDAHSTGPPSASSTAPWLDVIRPGVRHVSIIGAGNVALDVARILLRARTPTSTFLAGTDIPSAVLAQLAQTQVEHVSIVARRGVAQVAFTNKEVREMLTLGESEGIDFVPLSKEAGELALDDVARLKELSDGAARALKAGEWSGGMDKETFAKHASELAGELRIRKRLIDLLIKGSKAPKPDAVGHRKSWSVEAFRAPEAILPKAEAASSADQAEVGQVRWTVTEPVPLPRSADPEASVQVPSNAAQTPTWGGGTQFGPSANEPRWGSVQSTGKTVTTDTDAVVYSLGYVGAPLPLPSSTSSSQPASTAWQRLIPFDERRAVVKNEKGLVHWNAEAAAELNLSVEKLPQVHATGWIGRGPVGVIASTMYDAYDAVDLMLSRAASAPSHVPVSDPLSPPAALESALLSKKVSSPSERRTALTPRERRNSAAETVSEPELAVEGLAGSVVEWEDWEIVDEFERAAGAAHKPAPKEREKVVAFS